MHTLWRSLKGSARLSHAALFLRGARCPVLQHMHSQSKQSFRKTCTCRGVHSSDIVEVQQLADSKRNMLHIVCEAFYA
jgi:hypothetical protein